MEDGGGDSQLVVLDPARVIAKTRKGGRTSTYTDAIGQEIADAVAVSIYGIGRLCAEHPNWPHQITISHWEHQHESFARMMQAARFARADWMVAEAVEIADDADGDVIQIGDQTVPNPVSVARAKVRVETRLRVAKMLHPKKYGDKLDVSAAFGYVSQEDAIRQLK